MSGVSAVRNGSVLEHATTPSVLPRAMQQSSLNEFESGDSTVPYEIPFDGSEDQARAVHREWYWSQNGPIEDYLCPDCERGYGSVRGFDVHHIDENPLNGHPANLVGVCVRCHRWRHSEEKSMSLLTVDEWKDEFLSINTSDFGAPAD